MIEKTFLNPAADKLKSADSTDNTSNTKGKFCGRGNARNGIRKETSTYVNLEWNPKQIRE